MTILFNVSDAVGPASTHGITRVERKLAQVLLDTPDVEFVALHERTLWRIDRAAVAERLRPESVVQAPIIERFGADPPATLPPGLKHQVRSAFTRVRAGAPALGTPLSSLRPTPGDVLVSVGVDWQHGLIDEAERLVYGNGCRYAGFCYDLIPIDHPEWLFPPAPETFIQHFARMAHIASSIVCISKSTQRDFQRHFPDVVRDQLPVLALGADAALETEPHHGEFARSIFDGEPYAVYCATLDRRKNHQLLYRAMRQMVRRGLPGNLVFVGKLGGGVSDLVQTMRNDPYTAGRIAHVTGCDDQHLAAIYANSAFAVYPSLYEGWGLGVTESLAHGRRCIVASGSSLAEASFGTAIEIHPLSTTPWVDAMQHWFVEPELAACQPPALPTWQSATRDLVELVSR